MFEVNDIAGSDSKGPETAAFTPVRPAHIRSDNRRAFSLVELTLLVIILSIFAVIAVPRLDYGIVEQYKLETTTRKPVTDLRRIRGLAILNAATNSKGFSLNMFGPAPYGYELRNLDSGAVLETYNFDAEVSVTGGTRFEFEPLGNLSDASDTQFTVSGGGQDYTITIVRSTGKIICVCI